MRRLSLLLLLAVPLCGQTSSLPDAPRPRHETFKFAAASSFFALSSAAMNYAIHDGARACQREDNSGGQGRMFGTRPVFGGHPPTASVLLSGAALLGSAGMLEALHHPKLAKRILIYGGTAQFGMAGATKWAGCN